MYNTNTARGIIDLINDLRTTSSINDKINKLKKNITPTLEKVLYLTYDPFTQYYIKKKIKFKKNKKTKDLDDMFSIFKKLSNRSITGNAAINEAKNFLSNTDNYTAELFQLILQKDLKAGIKEAIINKAFNKKLIFTYPVMLCTPKNDKTIKAIKFPAISQIKEDGMRFNAIVKNGKVEYRSRTGSLINFSSDLDQEFIRLYNLISKDGVFDGELLCVDSNGKLMDRKISNGIINKAIKGTINKKESELIVAHLWDFIDLKSFKKWVGTEKYKDRFEKLTKNIDSTFKKIKCVEYRIVNNIKEAYEHYKTARSNNFEWIVLKNIDSVWEAKRSKYNIKFKEELTTTLKVVGWQEGTGKYSKMLGSLLCETEDGILKVNIGSGFTDEQRKKIDKSCIGKLVEVMYNDVIISKKGKTPPSLFLPRFLEFREDKDTADTFEHLMAQKKN